MCAVISWLVSITCMEYNLAIYRRQIYKKSNNPFTEFKKEKYTIGFGINETYTCMQHEKTRKN